MNENSFLYLSLLLGFSGMTASQVKKPNILFICVDDLRPEVGCYKGKNYIKTPNLDRLAAQGMSFSNHFAVVPTSGASRYAMLTGRYPVNRTGLSNEACYKLISGQSEQQTPETFIHQLRRNGYYSVGIGKISHSTDGYIYEYEEPKSNLLELPHSWDEVVFDHGQWGTGWNAFFGFANGSDKFGMESQVKPYECGDTDDDGYVDGLTANLALQKLKELAMNDQPFFLGVGFFKPHLPFNAPRKYWDMYDEASLPLTPVPDLPENVNKTSLHDSGEFNSYYLGDEDATLDHPVADDYARKLRHAYFACVSYADAQVGKLLDELKRLGLSDNTIVVVWGDHGWHLGDFRMWGKHTMFDWALRSTLIVKSPKSKSKGNCNQVISAVDIYPTLMELCRIKTDYPLDGRSFVALLDKPSHKWNGAVYSYWNHGITVRTDRYRLTRYFNGKQPEFEFFDHRVDPNEKQNMIFSLSKKIHPLQHLLEKANTEIYRNYSTYPKSISENARARL